MKKLSVKSLLFILIMGCNNISVVKNDQESSITTIQRINEAENIAEEFISNNQDDFESTTIKSNILWYNPTQNDPAYIEFVLENNGYIFISLTDNDILIGSYGSGSSIFKRISDEVGDDSFIPYKLSNTDYLALFEDESYLIYNIISSDFNYYNASRGTDSIHTFFAKYNQTVSENNGIISVRSDYLENIETNSRGWFSDKTMKVSLRNYQSKLPSYSQYEINGKKSGCVPTAFAMACGYWYYQHGRTRLFTAAPPMRTKYNNPHPVVSREIEAIRGFINTDSSGNNSAVSTNGFIQYLYSKRYIFSSQLLLITPDFNHLDWTNIYTHTKNNKPVVILFNSTEHNKHASVIHTVSIRKTWAGWYKYMGLDIYLGATNTNNSAGTDYITTNSANLTAAVVFTVN